jgi:hypothetical protein
MKSTENGWLRAVSFGKQRGRRHTRLFALSSYKQFVFNRIRFGDRPAIWFQLSRRHDQVRTEGIMQMAITFMAVLGGLIFSLAVALLAEELIFGQVFRLFVASGRLTSAPEPVLAAKGAARVGQPVALKSVQKH